MMLSMVLHNSLTQKKEIFHPLKEGEVRIYSCGPTIYDYPHIGNYRSFLFSDLLHRVLRYLGYQVKLVMNITDIDDKTIRGSIQQKKSLSEYTQVYEQAFFEDLKTLNFLPAHCYPKATEHISQMVEMIKDLLSTGHAYVADGSVYFKISSFPDYGKLSKIKVDDQLAGAGGRVDSDEYEKDNVSDFVLWKGYHPDDGEVFYETELGKGRPGWHIECSAMSKEYLGKHFDIHTGGVDNRFPHHENEIAQSESAHHHPFVNYWLHASHLLVEGEKMSKSAGNFFTLRDLLDKKIRPQTLRYMMISVHYRSQYNFTQDGVEAADKALERIRNFLDVWYRVSASLSMAKENQQSEGNPILAEKRRLFFEYLTDDLNVSGALGVFYEYLSHAHKILHDSSPNPSDLPIMMSFLKEVDDCLGIIPLSEEDSRIPPELQKLLEKRNELRQLKKFLEADQIRQEITARGYEIIDTLTGSKLKKK